MNYHLYFAIRQTVRKEYKEYLRAHFPDYIISFGNTEDFSPEAADSSEDHRILLGDRDSFLEKASSFPWPRIAISHQHNKEEDLMNAPWLIQSPSALTPDFLHQVVCRHYGLPLTILETARCRVRELTSKDFDILHALQLENVHMPQACFFPRELTVDQEKDYLKNYISHQYPFFEYGIYGIEYKGEMCGIAGFHDYPDEKPGNIETGYALLKKYQQQGILSEILPGLVRYVKTYHDFELIKARIQEDNLPSLRLAGKCGLVIEVIPGHQ